VAQGVSCSEESDVWGLVSLAGIGISEVWPIFQHEKLEDCPPLKIV